MWASILRGEVTLLKQPRPRILDFGDLATFSLDRGIDDAAWKQTAVADPILLPAPENVLFEVPQ